jgi:hypothetical protein
MTKSNPFQVIVASRSADREAAKSLSMESSKELTVCHGLLVWTSNETMTSMGNEGTQEIGRTENRPRDVQSSWFRPSIGTFAVAIEFFNRRCFATECHVLL